MKNTLYSIGALLLWFSPASLGVIPIINQPEPEQVVIEVEEEEVEPPSTPQEEVLDLNKKEDLIKFAEKKVKERFGETEWQPFYELIDKESSWIVGNVNHNGGACGLGQAYPCSKLGDAYGNPEAELNWAMDYVADRYDSPWNALQFHNIHNWY